MTWESDIDEATMQAVGQLLRMAEQHRTGVTFTPDNEGWTVGYMRGMGGGDLAKAYDLETAARAAMRPLSDLTVQKWMDNGD